MEKVSYVVPEVEVLEVVVEQGFAESEGGNLQNPNEGGDI